MLPDFFSEKTKQWFASAIGEPTPVQAQGWHAIARGGDVLISAPTGTGKTLTAFLYFLDALSREKIPPEGMRILYLSPLKALGNDIRENLRRPLEGLGLEQKVQAAVRTGDTPAAERARQAKHPPQIFITTPESLYLLLTSGKGRRMLSSLQCVIVDELHALMDSKRGMHLALSLERLDALCGKRLQRIALSATVRPMEAAVSFLTGGRGAEIVAPPMEKGLEVQVELPEKDLRSLPEHSVWPALAQRIVEHTAHCRTILAFVDGRAQAEKLAQGINAAAGARIALTHHGCVSREQRLEAEQQLRRGEIQVLCCTSSMELGIDVGEIDLVLQIGAPRSISGALQRAGRAGHGPGRISRLTIYPKTEADCLDAALAARGASEKRIESAHIPQLGLDVLAQHLISMAAAGDYTADEALSLARGAWPYRNLTREKLESVLEMLAGDFEHARDLPVRPRLLYDRIHGQVSGDRYTRMLAFSNVGTIPDRGWYAVTLEDGTRLGELDEEYVFEARLGDKFLLGAFAWRIQEITRDRVIVTPATPEGARSPFWKGDSMGRPLETGRLYGKWLGEMNAAMAEERIDSCLKDFPLTLDARETVKRVLRRQMEATGCLPDDKTILAEHFADSAGDHQLMIHSVFGARVNHALAILLRHAAQEKIGLDVRGYDDDSGILLYTLGNRELPLGLLQSLNAQSAPALLEALLPGESVFSMAFRYAAARAGIMGAGKNGRNPLWVQRLRGAESLSAAVGQENHPLIWEAGRECREDYLDMEGAAWVLSAIAAGEIRVVELHTRQPSPMALPLRRQVEAEMMYESPIPAAADAEVRRRLEGIAPDAQALAEKYEHARKLENPEQLHTLLMTEGDLAPGEIDAPAQWLEELAAAGRAMYIEPGLWIAQEHAPAYADGPTEAILRRLLRYRGPQTVASVAQRYALPEETARNLLNRLCARGEAVPFEDAFVHPDVYAAAQRLTLRRRRDEIHTAAPERLARWMAAAAEPAGDAQTRLAGAISALAGLEVSAAQWEEIIFPRRVPGYRPETLDQLLSQGQWVWVLSGEPGKPRVKFLPVDALDFDAYTDAAAASPEEALVLSALEKSGAQFDTALARRLGGLAVTPILQRLAEKGWTRQDGFGPVRRLLQGGKVSVSMGRWERACRERPLTREEAMDRQLNLCPILCRETCGNLSWPAALEKLRSLELSGVMRRGYFVSGLSGAQFVYADDLDRVRAALERDSGEYVCLNAVDPAQLWGKLLKHLPGREFLIVSGTAVVLRGGVPVCVFERQGAVLRLFEDDPQAVECFARAFTGRRVFWGKTRVCVKEFSPAAPALLQQAGFRREALDYVLYQA